jgi:hypothetical protein
MPDPLFLLLPAVLGATRSLAFGMQPASKDGVHSTIPAETEYQALLVAIFCLVGLLLTLSAMVWFPDLGAEIAQYNQF